MPTTEKASSAKPTHRGTAWQSWIGPGGWGIYALGLVPGVWTFHLAVSDQLGADPLKVLERALGLWALRFLVIGLAITPLRRFGGPNLIRFRRTVGVLAFLYALAHVIVYVWLDQGLDLTSILKDIWKRPYITVGMLAFLILVPLAATSNGTMIKRLGASAWQRLHRWVYLAAASAAVHFVMLEKTWHAEPIIYAAIVAGLLLVRIGHRGRTPTTKRKVVLEETP